MLPELPPPPPPRPPSPPAAASRIISGQVSCQGCPPGPVYLQAWAETDRYNWPWWNVYGFLDGFHKPAELDAIRPAPLATVRLASAGPFQLEIPAHLDVHIFAQLDANGDGPKRGPLSGDWIGRFPRNPIVNTTTVAPFIELYPLVWATDFEQHRYRSPVAPAGAPRFSDATLASGARFRHCQGGDVGLLPVVVGSGALLEDLDGDGDLDLLAVQGIGECPESHPGSALFANDGRGNFRDVTRGSGLDRIGANLGVTGGDIDRDGDVDLYFTSVRGGSLFRNDGQLHFSEIPRGAGTAGSKTWPVSASFGDVDSDGWLDLFVANYVDFSTSPPFTPDAEIPAFVTPMLSSPFAFPAQPDRLYLSRKKATAFELAPEALGAADPTGKGMASVLADLDHDGDLDLYVTNDCTSDRLFEWRDDRFHDVTASAGVADISSGMGIALGDIDGDGLPDLFSPHWLNEPNVLYQNASSAGRLLFNERTHPAGLGASGNGLTGWAANFFDADLDGDLDLMVTNGHTHPGSKGTALEPQPLQLFTNDGRGSFIDVSSASGPALLAPQVSRGAAFGDIDGDGDIDAWIVAWNGSGRLLRNETTGRRWLKVRLLRASGETGAIGARVELRCAGRRQVREIASGTGYLSHSALESVFGLPGRAPVESLEVVWPGGQRERFAVPGVNRALTLREGLGKPVTGPGR